ncbi:MAG: DNA alkylation repair protein [Planctomycetes bacterium]|nr:DNA alkylation repair protein [Planctomycetota bacterium]
MTARRSGSGPTRTSGVELRRVAEEVREGLSAAADEKYLEQIRRLVPGIRTCGVRVPAIRAQVKALAAAQPQLDFAATCSLLDAFCAGGCRDEILFAVFLASRFRKAIPTVEWPRIGKWVKAIDNWETCDQLAMNLVAPLVAAHPERVDDLLEVTKSPNSWHRRFAVAATAALNQKGRSLPEATMRVCARLMDDAEPMVRKAVAWAIREASERDEAAAFAFLMKPKKRAAASLLREALEKLTPAHRAALCR